MPAAADNLQTPDVCKFYPRQDLRCNDVTPAVCGQSHSSKPYFPVKYFALAMLCSSNVLLKIVFPAGVER